MPRSKNPKPNHISSPENKNIKDENMTSLPMFVTSSPSTSSPLSIDENNQEQNIELDGVLNTNSTQSNCNGVSQIQPFVNGVDTQEPSMNGVLNNHSANVPTSDSQTINGVASEPSQSKPSLNEPFPNEPSPNEPSLNEPIYQPGDGFRELLDKFQNKNFTEKKKRKKEGSLDLLSPRIIPWLKKRFSLKKGAKTSASQVIELYRKDFQDFNSIPLHNYQVGQLVRRLFPEISRCKITLNGKRVWVYKDLNILDENEIQQMSDVVQKTNGISPNQKNSNLSLSLRSSIEESLSPSQPQKYSGILYNLLYPHKKMSDVTTVEKKNPAEGDIIQWLHENYEYSEGSYVRSQEILRRHNKDRETWMKYLSQVGRIIKHVFPKARHIRKSVKGGKREWIYHNIRSKIPFDDVNDDDGVTSYNNSRPTMVVLDRGWNRAELGDEIPADSNSRDPSDEEPNVGAETTGDEIPIDYSLTPSTGDVKPRIINIKTESSWQSALTLPNNDDVNRSDVMFNLVNRKRSFDDVTDHERPEKKLQLCKTELSPNNDVTKQTTALQERFSYLTKTLLGNNRFTAEIPRILTNQSPPNIHNQSETRKDSSPRLNGNHRNQKVDEHVMKWEELPMCPTFNYGWALAPVNKGCNFFEWFLFEGQELCSGHRVFKELKIFSDWSVQIHVIGRRVFPDELGGITDLQKTRKSVDKVFLTLAESTICRGFPALCLSDLKVHEVVVAKTEIWSSRDSEEEELRHRAINCQVLFREKGDCCQKCSRVTKAHSSNSQRERFN